jgi:hypothetical protein
LGGYLGGFATPVFRRAGLLWEAGTRMMHLVLDFDRELAKIGE